MLHFLKLRLASGSILIHNNTLLSIIFQTFNHLEGVCVDIYYQYFFVGKNYGTELIFEIYGVFVCKSYNLL